MKIANSAVTHLANGSSANGNKPFQRAPPLSLLPEIVSKDDLDLRKKTSYMLKVDPSDPDNTSEFKFSMYHADGTDSLRTTIQWYKDIQVVLKGLGLHTNAEGMVPLIEATCEASAKAAFQDTLQTVRRRLEDQLAHEMAMINPLPGEPAGDFADRLLEAEQAAVIEFALTPAHVTEALRAVITNTCPYKVLQKQKRFMRRYMRKPKDMKVRTYVHSLMKLNTEEIPFLPPFGANQTLTEDEIIEIILNACPNSWSQEMDRQDFDPESQSIRSLLQFCERIEQLEPSSSNNNNGNKKAETANKRSKANTAKKNTGKWCSYHKSDSHDTADCKVLLNKNKGDNKPQYKNKSWKKKADDNKQYSKEELNALVTKVVAAQKKAWEKEKRNNKRKGEAANAEEELNAVDQVEVLSDTSTEEPSRQEMEDLDFLLASVDLEKDDSSTEAEA